MKRLALLLFGISKNDKYKHWLYPSIRVDYTKSIDNYREYIFSYFEKLGYAVDVYFASNELGEADRAELVRHYNPKGHRFVADESADRTTCRNAKLGAVVDACLESKIEYDLVIVTRFDLLFQRPFGESDIRFDQFNMVSVLESDGVICDNFYLMPFSYLHAFAGVIKEWGTKSFHFIEPLLKRTFGEVHYILNETQNVFSLSFYKIVREHV